ncbi:MAG: histidine phosphatase family protein [bacterium]|nr:histidine phosphatase family protein [bacterium]MCP5070290.1 histidine phosphatase family protein [bacterium]
MAIYLIRHGETALNASGVMQSPETPLSENGLAQAERLGARLLAEDIAHILASDYARAAMTADAVQRATGVALDSEPLLRERNLGDLRGRAYAELDFDPFAEGYAPPNGETWEAFHERVDRAWEQVVGLAARTDGNLAVVTHGLVCRSVVLRLAEAGQAPTSGYGWFNTSVTILDQEPPFKVHLLNCARHLEDAELKGPA